MITEDYVSFEVAKLLAEKGFDGESHKHYWGYESGKEFLTEGSFNPEYDYPAPTLQMAMKWLREKHNIFISISFRFSCNADNDINFSYYAEKYENHYGCGDGEFISYEEACEAAIEYCLENLI